jgi:hypothetical protein
MTPAPPEVKRAGRGAREFADIHAMAHGELSAAGLSRPAKGELDFTQMPK